MEILPTILLDKGEAYTRTITRTTLVGGIPGLFDFTDWTGTFIIKDRVANETLYEGELILGGTNGTITIDIPDTETIKSRRKNGAQFCANIQLNLVDPAGVTRKILKGQIKIETTL